MLIGRSKRACLCREVPTDHEAHGQTQRWLQNSKSFGGTYALRPKQYTRSTIEVQSVCQSKKRRGREPEQLNPQDLLQNRSLQTVPICIVLHCSPHDNTVCNHMYDECKRSNEKTVCHKLWSILWSIVQVCSLTIEYQVVQYVPSISITKQFESILLTILPRISILLL